MVLKPEHLAALNLVLDANPDLKAAIVGKVEQAVTGLNELKTSLGPAVPSTPEAPNRDKARTERIQGQFPKVPAKDAPTAPHGQEAMTAAIMGWFQKNNGKRRLNECRAALGVSQGSKPFKTALAHLQAEDLIKGSGKVGMGAEYWLTKKGEKWTPPVAQPQGQS